MRMAPVMRCRDRLTATAAQRGSRMFINKATLRAWTPRMLSVLRIVTALLFLQYGLSKYFGWPANPPVNFSTFSLIGLAGAIELLGSLLLLAGVFSREAAFIMSGE